MAPPRKYACRFRSPGRVPRWAPRPAKRDCGKSWSPAPDSENFGARRRPRSIWCSRHGLKSMAEACDGRGRRWLRRAMAAVCSAGLHSDRAVETDGLAVQHYVLENLNDERREFIGLAETRREGRLFAE